MRSLCDVESSTSAYLSSSVWRCRAIQYGLWNKEPSQPISWACQGQETAPRWPLLWNQWCAFFHLQTQDNGKAWLVISFFTPSSIPMVWKLSRLHSLRFCGFIKYCFTLVAGAVVPLQVMLVAYVVSWQAVLCHVWPHISSNSRPTVGHVFISVPKHRQPEGLSYSDAKKILPKTGCAPLL